MFFVIIWFDLIGEMVVNFYEIGVMMSVYDDGVMLLIINVEFFVYDFVFIVMLMLFFMYGELYKVIVC